MEKIKCSLIGLGRIGSSLEDDPLREKPCTHAGTIVSLPECELSGGCDTDLKKCEGFKKKWQCTAVFTNISELLNTNQPDILIIATPPETHLQIIKQALSSAPKVIICEKPLAVQINHAYKIVQLGIKHSIKIITNHERRYSLDYLMVKEHIHNQTFGELLSITARLYIGKNRSLDNILLYDGTHLIDIIQFLTSSSLIKINSYRFKQEASESIIVNAKVIKNNNFIPIIIEAGTGRNHLVFEVDLLFSHGRIRVGNGLYEEYESKSSPFYESMNSLLKNNVQRPEITGYFVNMLKDAIACFKEPLREPVSSAYDGYCAQLFIDSLLKRKKYFNNK